MGAIEMDDLRAISMPLPSSSARSGVALDGILGFSTLAALDCVQIDFGTGAVHLLSPKKKCPVAGHVLPFRLTSGGVPEIPARLDNRRIWMRIDSGSEFGFVFDSKESISLARDPALDQIAVDVLGEETMTGGRLLGPILLADLRFERPAVYRSSRAATHIGMDELRRLRMTFDMSARHVSIELSAAAD